MNKIKFFISGMLEKNQKFTDIHLVEDDPIRFRRLGNIQVFLPKDKEVIINKYDITEFLNDSLLEMGGKPKDWEQEIETAFGDMDFALTVCGNRFRCNMCWAGGFKKLSLSLRKLNPKAVSITELDLPPIVTDFTNRAKGLILVTGQTGSGKSTTMAGMIEYVKELQQGKIVTIEDPIEYVFKSGKSLIMQREIGADSKSFAKALRASLRQDPDVIMIGELRDRETMEAALSAAETGHLVISTLHTNSARQTIERVVSFLKAMKEFLQ